MPNTDHSASTVIDITDIDAGLSDAPARAKVDFVQEERPPEEIKSFDQLPPQVSTYPYGLSFLTDYTFYNSNNEAPKLFHLMSALSVLATAISRKVWIAQGYFTFYPNLYVVMVGDPGGGKSTALDVAKKFVRNMKTVPLAADAMTTQALLRYMSEEGSPCKKSIKIPGHTPPIVEYCPITIFAGELISFIGMDPYGWITFLTTVYHEEVHEVKTKNKGDDLINGPYVNLLGCMTPDITANLLQQRVISSGMARRTIFVWGSGRGEPIAFPEISDEQKEAMQRCATWAMHLATKVKGQFEWTQEARDFYKPWYEDLRRNIQKYCALSTAGYFESKHVQLLKMTMLVSLAESDELKITVKHLKLALHILEDVEKDMHKVFEGQGRNQEASIAAKLTHMVEAANTPPTVKSLYVSFYGDCNREEMDKIIHHLDISGTLCKVGPFLIKGRECGPYLCTPSQKKYLKEKLGALGEVAAPQSDVLVDASTTNSVP